MPDDSPPLLSVIDGVDAKYRCPGESYSISRAIHLGRLASAYAACQRCEHRLDTGPLSRRTARRRGHSDRRRAQPSLFGSEAFEADYINQVSAVDVLHLARAFGIHLLRSGAAAGSEVLLANDGGELTPELVSAVSQGLRWAGFTVVDVGVTCAATLVWAQQRFSAGGSVLITQLSNPSFRIRVSFWGAGGRPLSSPGNLESLRALAAGPLDRPQRFFGPIRYEQPDADYLATLIDYYHALRPLRFVIDCPAAPIMNQLRRLSANVDCELVPVEELKTAAADLGEAVRAAGAHFGAAIDDCGRALRLWNERGKPVPPECLLALLASHLRASVAVKRKSTVIVQRNSASWLIELLSHRGFKVVRSSELPECLHAAMCDSQALMGGDLAGRFWFAAGGAILPDALRALSLVLVILSAGDQPLSAVLPAEGAL